VSAATFEPVGAVHRLGVVARGADRYRSLAGLAVGTSAALVGALAVGLGIGVYPALGGDEGIYTSQAWAVLHGDITPYTYTYDHPFVGWAQLAPLQAFAAWSHWGGDNTVVAGRAVMVLYAFATLLLTFGVARRIGMRLPFAVTTVLLLGICPLFVVDARQVYLDNIALPWLLGSFFLALSPARRQWTYGLAGVLFGVAVLSKETVLVLLPALAYVVSTRAYRPIRAMSMVSFVTLGTAVVLAYPLFALLRTELLPGPGHVSLWTNGIMYQLASRKGSGALWESGSARQALVGYWLSYDPVLVLGGTAGGIVCLFSRRLRVVGLAVLLWSLPVLKPGGYLPAMYVIAVLPFGALAVVGVLEAGWNRVTTQVARWRPERRALVTSRGAVSLGAALVLAAVATTFVPGLRTVLPGRDAAVAPADAAVAYVADHVPLDADVVVDPAFWTDLVEQGRGEPWHGVISYYQFDLDPKTSSTELPDGWRDVDYVLQTSAMTSNLHDLELPRTAAAIAHSSVVRSWGSGSDQVTLRRVDGVVRQGAHR
jgi:hypothetical protein